MHIIVTLSDLFYISRRALLPSSKVKPQGVVWTWRFPRPGGARRFCRRSAMGDDGAMDGWIPFKHTKNYGKSIFLTIKLMVMFDLPIKNGDLIYPFFWGVNQLFRLGHFNYFNGKLFVYLRVT